MLMNRDYMHKNTNIIYHSLFISIIAYSKRKQIYVFAIAQTEKKYISYSYY